MQFIRVILAAIATAAAITHAAQGEHLYAAISTVLAVFWLANLAVNADRR